MGEKIICTILVLLWQVMISIYIHMKYKNKKYDIFNAIYQLVLFIIFQIMI